MPLEMIDIVVDSDDGELFKYYLQYFIALEAEMGGVCLNESGVVLDEPSPSFIQAIEDVNKYISQLAGLEACLPNDKIKPFADKLSDIIQNDPNYKSKMFLIEKIPKSLKDYFIVRISNNGNRQIEYQIKEYIKDYYAKYKNNELVEDYDQFLELLNLMAGF